MNIISLSHAEFASNVDFAFTLAEKGHTLKVTTDNGKVLLVSPVATQLPEGEVKIPTPEEFVPDPVGTRQFVDEALNDMTNDF